MFHGKKDNSITERRASESYQYLHKRGINHFVYGIDAHMGDITSQTCMNQIDEFFKTHMPSEKKDD